MNTKQRVIFGGVAASMCFLTVTLLQGQSAPVNSVLDPGVITTRQAITPAGVQMVFRGRAYGVAFGESGDTVWALVGSSKAGLLYKLDWRANRMVEVVRAPVAPGMQGIAFDAAAGAPVITGTNGTKAVQLVGIRGGAARVESADVGRFAVGGVALLQDPPRALAALTFNDELAIIDRATGSAKKVRTGIAPFGVIANAAQTIAYVSNWGGRFPKKGDLTSPTGNEKNADHVVVDARGIAASGTIARVDLAKNEVTHTIEVGLHPTAMALDEARQRLYVANSNSDTVTVIDTQRYVVVQTISIQPFERKVAGVAPEALALSKDGKRLYVACAGLNAVAVVVLRPVARVEGLIPTGWYPNHIALSADGTHLAVSTMLGVGSGPRDPEELRKRAVHSNRGTVHVIALPDAAQLAGFTTAVAENNRLRLPRDAAAPSRTPPATVAVPVPRRAGEPSLIKHVVYVVKENRSYDQYFGDIAKGNGDASLLLVGDDVVPNQRKLAQEFVLLDNFYANGG